MKGPSSGWRPSPADDLHFPRTGKQYVVIAAGEYGFMNTIMGDHVVSYSLKGAGE